jgi:DNA-binding GntR family transcriptional regulator
MMMQQTDRKISEIDQTPTQKLAINTVHRVALHKQVAMRLRDLIVKGQLVPGAQVRISDLSAQLNVSLTPIREALKILAEEQLVELRPNRSTRIAPITIDNTRALFEVTAEIESLAAELAATRMTEAELAQLEELHSQMFVHHKNNEIDAYFTLNNEVHDLIVDFARNDILTHMRSKLELRARRVRFRALRYDNRRNAAMQEHDNVMVAFRARSPVAARRAWREHFFNSGAETCRVLQATLTGPGDPAVPPSGSDT